MTAPMTPECRTVFMLGVGIMGRDVGVFIVGEVPLGGACTYGASCAVEGFGFFIILLVIFVWIDGTIADTAIHKMAASCVIISHVISWCGLDRLATDQRHYWILFLRFLPHWCVWTTFIFSEYVRLKAHTYLGPDLSRGMQAQGISVQ